MRTLILCVITFLFGLVLAYFVIIRPERMDRDNLVSLLDEQRLEFTVTLDEIGRETATQRQTITNLRNALDAKVIDKEELEKHNLRQLQTIIRLEGEIKKLQTKIPFVEPIIVEIPTGDSINMEQYLRIPQQFYFQDDWTRIVGTIFSRGITIEDLTIKTGETIYLGYQRRGFLRRAEPVVIVEYANPDMNTVSMENIQVITPPPFYNRPWWYRGQGALVVGLLFFLIN